jgi:hypothetical protein
MEITDVSRRRLLFLPIDLFIECIIYNGDGIFKQKMLATEIASILQIKRPECHVVE